MNQAASHITQSAEQWITTTNKLITSKILLHIKISTVHRNPAIEKKKKKKNGAVANLKGTVLLMLSFNQA